MSSKFLYKFAKQGKRASDNRRSSLTLDMKDTYAFIRTHQHMMETRAMDVIIPKFTVRVSALRYGPATIQQVWKFT